MRRPRGPHRRLPQPSPRPCRIPALPRRRPARPRVQPPLQRLPARSLGASLSSGWLLPLQSGPRSCAGALPLLPSRSRRRRGILGRSNRQCPQTSRNGSTSPLRVAFEWHGFCAMAGGVQATHRTRAASEPSTPRGSVGCRTTAALTVTDSRRTCRRPLPSARIVEAPMDFRRHCEKRGQRCVATLFSFASTRAACRQRQMREGTNREPTSPGQMGPRRNSSACSAWPTPHSSRSDGRSRPGSAARSGWIALQRRARLHAACWWLLPCGSGGH